MTQQTGIAEPQFGADVVDQAGWDLPEQIGGYRTPLQPGPYRFKFPGAALIRQCLKDIKQTVLDVPDTPRIAAAHRDGAELQVIQVPPSFKDRLGEAFPTRISNAERRRGKKDDPKTKTASDMDYVLMLCGVPGAEKPTARDEATRNNQYKALYEKYVPEKEMGADVEWNWSCNDGKPIRVADESGQKVVLDGKDGREERNGCGKRYYQKDIDRVMNEETGLPEFPREIQCECGGVLYANENLTNFRR